MEQINSMHKRRLYSLIIAGATLIALILPWASFSFGGFGGGSVNGFRSWGLLSLAGVAGAAIASFMGDQKTDFDETFKKVALGSFAAIAAGALIFFIRLNSIGGPLSGGISAGIGLWLALALGVVGVLWTMGIVKLPDINKGSGSANPPPPNL